MVMVRGNTAVHGGGVVVMTLSLPKIRGRISHLPVNRTMHAVELKQPARLYVCFRHQVFVSSGL